MALAVLAGAAGADVKAGADAWGRGDYAAAIREWQAPAEQGDPDAQFNMGQAYRLGRGVARNLPRAEELFGKAAAQGHLQAADNYGLLLFDRGERAHAMPYVRAAADRGDPRAQYLMGIAHFNGDLAAKDWPRAYALMTLAQGAGLAQAAGAIAQMNQNIPLAQRQAGATLATRIAAETEARRSTQMAAADLSAPTGAVSAASPRAAPAAAPRPESAVPAAVRLTQGGSAATAGADYARPAVSTPPPAAAGPKAPVQVAAKPPAPPAPRPVPVAARPVESKPAAPKPARPPVSAGPWRVQLGAFGVPANADALWARVKGRPEIAGHARINAPAGKVIKLQAGGYASREAANAACAALGRAGIACVPAQD